MRFWEGDRSRELKRIFALSPPLSMLNISGICTWLYMTGGDLDFLGENRPYPRGAWQGRRALYHFKNCSDSPVHTYTMQGHHWAFSKLAGRHVYLQLEREIEIEIESEEEAIAYLSAIWSHIWWSSGPIHHPYCGRWQHHWPGSQLQLLNTVSPLRDTKNKRYSHKELGYTARQWFVVSVFS